MDNATNAPKLGRSPSVSPNDGLTAFASTFGATKLLLVGGDGIPIGDFLAQPIDAWI